MYLFESYNWIKGETRKERGKWKLRKNVWGLGIGEGAEEEKIWGKRSLGVAHVNQMQLILLVFFISHHGEERFVTKYEEKEKSQMHHRRSDKVLDMRIHFLKLQNLWKVCHHCDPWYQLEFVTRYSANVLAVKIQWRHVYEKLPFPLLMRNTLPTCIFAFMLCITKSGITPWAECKTKRKYLFCLTQLINLLYLLTSQDLRLESKPAFVCLNIRPTSNNRSRELLLFQNDAKMHKCPQKSTAFFSLQK